MAPEITCADAICSTETSILDVDTLATNITWSLTPSNLFSGATSGIGKTATITPSGYYNGTGRITYNFQMPGGESFSIEKTFGVKGPKNEDITFDVYTSNGILATQMYGTWLLCPNTTYHIYVENDNSSCSTSNYTWSVPSAWTTYYTYQNMISVNTNSSPGGPVSVTANTCCNNNVTIISGYMGSNYNCSYYSMLLSPNPATSETVLTLVANSEETIFDENVEWQLEVYDKVQLLKEKKTKIKGKEVKIKTSGWADGIYFIRVRYKDELVLGKLVVKK